MKISAVVLTKNEEKNIQECLKSLNFCDEIIIIDDCSTDKTRKIAKKLEVKVFTRSLNYDFASQRNFGLKKTNNDWVLFVDADERISPTLRAEITNYKLQITDCFGFYIRRKDYFLGRWLNHGETANIKLLRLVKKGTGQWKRKVHEFWQIEKGRVGVLRSPLLHYPHPSVSQFLEQINEYTNLNARCFYEKGQRFQFWQMLFYPQAKFLQNYCLRLGFLDGFPGFVMAFMMSLHSLITRIKLWEMEKKSK
ncbi:glycosyltransferase family 2 protein [Candidatus Microgenomates bacterium]|nr:glycosyltransferase family 2 protein [Candidatus Microgenomates bacterium]